MSPRAILVVVCCAGRHGAGAEAPWVVPADGEPFRGRLAGADAAWQLRFATDDGERTIAAGDLVRWGAFAEPGRAMFVVLADGGLVVATSARIDEEHVECASATFGKFALPIELVAAIVFAPPSDRAARDALLARTSATAGRSDRVLLDNGDELLGTITALDDKQLVLRTEAGPLEMKTETLVAIVFDPSLVDKPPSGGLRAVVGFDDGSRVTARELVADDKRAHLTLGGAIDLEAATPAIVALQALGGRVEYLSDRRPAAYRHIPFLQLPWPYRDDRSVLGGQLRAGGRLYLKGLGMHSPSRLTYELDEPYQRFEAEAAIDDEAGKRGSVTFRVFVDDGSGTWQPRAESAVLRGGEAPQPISVDLAGVKRISLLVDFADRGDELDHADWLDARVVR